MNRCARRGFLGLRQNVHGDSGRLAVLSDQVEGVVGVGAHQNAGDISPAQAWHLVLTGAGDQSVTRDHHPDILLRHQVGGGKHRGFGLALVELGDLGTALIGKCLLNYG